jgi:hypothetical protein
MFCLGCMLAAEAARVPFVVLFPNVYPLSARGLPPFGWASGREDHSMMARIDVV